MQKIIFKSEQTGEEIEVSFGLLKSQSLLSENEIKTVLLGQANKNSTLLTTHFKSHPKDKLEIIRISDVD